MDSEFTKRIVVVTGAGRGIGRAIAEALAAQGAHVIVTARSKHELDDVVQTIKRAGGTAASISADLSDPETPARIMKDIRRDIGPVEILVNNAGVGSSQNPKPVIDFDDAFWNLSVAVNLTAPYLLSKLALPDMLKAEWGRIIMVASVNGKIPSPHGAAYTASKHGLLGLMKTLALETAGTGITANAICPGPVRTSMNNARVIYDAKRHGVEPSEIENNATPLGRRLEPHEMAPMVVYLASENAACVTGQSFNLDGGIVMSG